ncbi:MAG: DNA polymerase I, partial [Candidatus Omnitrophica bacterium]|nr:DNA polymerase I [Candidatus Omnitrophota bacterium]
YFKKYEGVKRFINKTIKKTQEIGYVTTLLNRRRYIPEINNSNERLRNFSERTAINTPVQGSAADLIKLAMIECARKFHGTSTKMIIQVHDELVFDVPKSEVSKIVKQVREIMENVVALKVPLKVDIEVGRNWLEMEPVL